MLSTSTLALTALAGCSGGGGGGDGSGGGSEDGGSSGSADTQTESGGDDGGGGSSPNFDGWMEGVGNYDGVVDETGSDEVAVAVGAQGNGGAFAFEPAAIRISAGTTVLWEWTGQGAQHNVAAEEDGFESDLSQEEGFTFEHTFSEAGTYKYVCTPHRTLGMNGVVVVE